MMPNEINRFRRGIQLKIGGAAFAVILLLAYGVPVIRPIDTSVYTTPAPELTADCQTKNTARAGGGDSGSGPGSEPSSRTVKASPSDAFWTSEYFISRIYGDPVRSEETDLNSISCPGWAEPAKVVTVSDGDTLYVELKDSSRHHVRLLGVNTPESGAAERVGYAQSSASGKLASDFTKKAIYDLAPSGQDVIIFLSKNMDDSTSDTDRYGRLLRIVWLYCPSEDSRQNEQDIRNMTLQGVLLTEGYAETAFYGQDAAGYEEMFASFELEAKSYERGLWQYGESAFERQAL